jgi:hypothetical protein
MANRLIVQILTKDFESVVHACGNAPRSNLLGSLQFPPCFLVGNYASTIPRDADAFHHF